MKFTIIVLLLIGCGSDDDGSDTPSCEMFPACAGNAPLLCQSSEICICDPDGAAGPEEPRDCRRDLTPDAGVGPTGLVNVPLDCQPYSRETIHAATDGSKDIVTNSWAVTSLVPGDRFVLSTCNAPVDPACGGGDVCSGILQPSATAVCEVSTSGTFLDGKLAVLCGIRTERFSSSGVLMSSTQSTFTVKLER